MVQDTGKLEVKTDNAEIEQVANHKRLAREDEVSHPLLRLGMIIDEDLTYEVHVDELCNKLSKQNGLLRHISPHLRKNRE